MKDHLICHLDLAVLFTKGKHYVILKENEKEFTITDDRGEEHSLTKHPDELGLSYKTWFSLFRNPIIVVKVID